MPKKVVDILERQGDITAQRELYHLADVPTLILILYSLIPPIGLLPQPLHVEGIIFIAKKKNCVWPQIEILKHTSRAFSAFVSVITPTAALAANIRRITCRFNKQYII